MLKTCPNCGKNFEDGRNFCGNCGAELTDRESSSKNQALTVQKPEVQKPVRKSQSFSSVFDADWFLRQHNNLIVKGFDVTTRTRLGLFANHASVKSVSITYDEYPHNIGYQYRINEEEKSHWFVVKGTDSSFAAKWEAENWGREYVAHKAVSHARGNASSLLFGFGNVVEHVSYYVLNRKKIPHQTV